MNDGSHAYYYDAEHHLVQVDGSAGYCQSGTGTVGGCYIYDAEGRRVRRALTQFGDTDDYLYDLSGHFIAQVSGTGWWVRDEIYAGGKHVATYENDLSTPTTFFGHDDWLGTERVQTAVNGVACETITSLAFGDGLTTSGSCDPTLLRFTGKQRDWESNLDNFDARYNSSQLGRFMSADPDNAGADPSGPQSWNMYSYVSNNPLNAVDPTGLDCVYLNDAGDAVDHVLTGGNPDCKSDTDNGYYVNGDVTYIAISTSLNSDYLTVRYTPAGSQESHVRDWDLNDGPSPAENLANAFNADNPGGFINGSMFMMASNAVGELGGQLLGLGIDALQASRAARAAEDAVDLANLSRKIVNDMADRNWTEQQILDTIQQAKESGSVYDVPNKATGGPATEYVSPSTGRFVVVDNATKQVLQVSKTGFLPNHLVH